MKRLIAGLLCLFLSAGSVIAAERIPTPVHSKIAVAASSTLVLPATRIIRSLLVLINDSDTTIYCNLTGAAAVANEGIRLNANGGSILLDVSVTSSAVYCIHGGSGDKTLLVTEG